jgi:2-oxoglutarate ferredoxin oxidoreductase subunit alpha
VAEFIAGHTQVFVVEQNRDAQMHQLLVNELQVDPAKLVKVLHYDGTPITARFIAAAIKDKLQAMQTGNASPQTQRQPHAPKETA